MKLLAILLTILLFAAKLCAGVALSWWLVFTPLILLAVWAAVLFVITLAVFVVGAWAVAAAQ